MERVLQKGGYQATYQVLLVRVIGMEQVDEPAHQALLFSKVLRVRVLCRLIWLVLDQCGHQAQDGVHLHAQTGRGSQIRRKIICLPYSVRMKTAEQ